MVWCHHQSLHMVELAQLKKWDKTFLPTLMFATYKLPSISKAVRPVGGLFFRLCTLGPFSAKLEDERFLGETGEIKIPYDKKGIG